MTEMTRVFDLDEAEYHVYFLPPEDAVIAAWHQYGEPFEGFKPQGATTWLYDQHPPVERFASAFGGGFIKAVTIADRFTTLEMEVR